MKHEDIETVVAAHPTFSGVVLVREAGRTIYERAMGYANRAEAISNTPDTRFATASGAKTFTAVAVCQLVERGKLAFDTPIRDCVPQDFPCKDGPATVHHLLCHTGGLPDYYDEDLPAEELRRRWDARPVTRVRRPADVLPLFPEGPVKFAPGARFSYSNGGYVLLGLAIEAASGMAYADYVTEHVLKRAGMADSGFFSLRALPPRAAFGYLKPDGLETNVDALPEVALPDGGAFVTAEDMSRFWQALRAFHLLGPETTARMMHPHAQASPRSPEHWYGYGLWLLRRDDAIVRLQASGVDAGVAFSSCLYPARDVALTVIGNDGERLWPLARALYVVIG